MKLKEPVIIGLVCVCISVPVVVLIDKFQPKLSSATASTQLVTDTATVIGLPTAHPTGTMVYPVLLTRNDLHAWLEANKLQYNPKIGDQVDVQYNEDNLKGNPAFAYHINPLSADSPEEVRRKIGK